MAYDHFPSMHEDLSADPEQSRVQALLAEMIAEGTDPRLVVDAALTTATALNVDLAGIAATACHLMQVSSTLAQALPEIEGPAKLFSEALKWLVEQQGKTVARTGRTSH